MSSKDRSGVRRRVIIATLATVAALVVTPLGVAGASSGSRASHGTPGRGTAPQILANRVARRVSGRKASVPHKPARPLSPAHGRVLKPAPVPASLRALGKVAPGHAPKLSTHSSQRPLLVPAPPKTHARKAAGLP